MDIARSFRFYTLSRSCVLWLAVSAVLGSHSNCSAQEPSESTIEYPVETKEFTVVVTDEEGKPIEGASVHADKIRPAESPGGWAIWPQQNVGPAPIVKTDSQGKATFQYPVRFGEPTHWNHPKIIIYKVQHADYIKKHFEHDVESSPATAEMVPGCELVVSAVDPQRIPISKLGVLVAGNHVQFLPGEEPNEIRSRAIPRGVRQVMLVGPNPKTGKHLFSKTRELNFGTSRRVSLRGLMLRPGMEFAGKLSENVPRPIKNGCIIAFCIPMPSKVERDAVVRWTDATPIREDGTFLFPSLPSTGKIQIIALCDGWVIDGETHLFAQRGVTYNAKELLAGDAGNNGVAIPMVPTTSAKVVVQDTNGKPIEGVKVYVSPNQSVHDFGGAQMLGSIYPTLDYLNKPIPSFRKRHPMDKGKDRYSSVTNKNGVAILPDVPTGSQFVRVKHSGFKLQKQKLDLNTGDMRQIELLEQKENSFEIRMVPTGNE